MAKVLVVYHSETGNTRAMAQAVADGVKEVPGVQVALKEADQVSVSDLIDADALAFGSPTYFSYMAGVIKAIFDKAYLSRSQLKGKPFAAFASGGGGEVKSLQSIESVAASCGLRRACEGVAVGGMPTDSDNQDCRKLGTTLAKTSKKQ
ncbi:MAG TPA: flavodoxin domain-containing protein [Dehalococcoidia bacterium]|nr:flavodoxin domain-containing protein [Dehalococcoidia bacterium]